MGTVCSVARDVGCCALVVFVAYIFSVQFSSSCLCYLLRFGVPRAATAITVPIKYVPEKVLCTMALASIAHLDVLKMGFGGLRCHMNIYIHRQSYTDVRVVSDQSGS